MKNIALKVNNILAYRFLGDMATYKRGSPLARKCKYGYKVVGRRVEMLQKGRYRCRRESVTMDGELGCECSLMAPVLEVPPMHILFG
eukprot:9471011-Pyramimonas_sp.AAC.1